ncbi:hypothetical protein [Dokdonia sp. Asnod1-B02]|uniref:hypothetical protein n=1 Tax=Dokdonia sp. Asnod1-B02 TaxID=3160573 RepID=UPI00386E6B55
MAKFIKVKAENNTMYYINTSHIVNVVEVREKELMINFINKDQISVKQRFKKLIQAIDSAK